jgi:hypothetical protein
MALGAVAPAIFSVLNLRWRMPDGRSRLIADAEGPDPEQDWLAGLTYVIGVAGEIDRPLLGDAERGLGVPLFVERA